VVGCDPESSQAALDLAERYSGVFAVVGWHPNYTAKYSKSSLVDLRRMLGHPKAVALGEIGLDWHWQYATPREQEAALLDQLELARELDKPVVFHCREAYADLLRFLEAMPRHRYLFHCFSGNADDAQRGVALDAYFGVDGPISYKSAGELRDIVCTLPRERLVIETDSPYLSPMPYRGKPNRPAYVAFVNGALASTLGIPSDECAALTTANAERFFRL
jgi:TatD DNase family protein